MAVTRISLLGLLASLLLAANCTAEPQILGWLEGAYLQPWGIRVRAKLDTGALTSSLHAEDIGTFERDGAAWVRFHLPYGRKEGYADGIIIERPLQREAVIKERVGESVVRYVVELDVCINGHTYRTPVSLFDRSKFNYPLIVGRTTLEGNIIVDSARTFIGEGECFRARPSVAPAPEPAAAKAK
ncbi:MAG: ATP-dependent zinc protease [Gammaproteobacteria bacterium]|nr:ATP-dependent zinc protease [Gammaproteobacteria bacterium]